jgi:hypothetical protein
LGTPTWVKTFKFAVSMSLYSASLIWLVGLTKDRIEFWAGQVIGVLMSLELVFIIIQGFRAQQMHYNLSGGFDTLLWDMMSTTIMLVMLTFLVLILRGCRLWVGAHSTAICGLGILLAHTRCKSFHCWVCGSQGDA